MREVGSDAHQHPVPLVAAGRALLQSWVPLLLVGVLVLAGWAHRLWQGYELSFDAGAFDFLAEEQAVEYCLDGSGVTVLGVQESLPPTYHLEVGPGEADQLASCLKPLGPGVHLRQA